MSPVIPVPLSTASHPWRVSLVSRSRLAMLTFLMLPQVRWFFAASLLAGGVVGLTLWWKHR